MDDGHLFHDEGLLRFPAWLRANRSASAALGRGTATSDGLVITILEALATLNMSVGGLTVTVIGFGKVGYHTARLLHGLGAKVVGVVDSKGAVYNAKGLTSGRCINTSKRRARFPVSRRPGI